MAAENDEASQEKRSIGAELIIPVCAVIFTLYYISTIIDSPWTAQVTAYFIGSILIAMCVVLFVIKGREVFQGKADLSVKALIETLDALPRRLGLFGLTLGYIVVLPWVGFTLTTFAFLSLGMLLLAGARAYGSSSGLTVQAHSRCQPFGWLVFIVRDSV
jgi:hypothetical protein